MSRDSEWYLVDFEQMSQEKKLCPTHYLTHVQKKSTKGMHEKRLAKNASQTEKES